MDGVNVGVQGLRVRVLQLGGNSLQLALHLRHVGIERSHSSVVLHLLVHRKRTLYSVHVNIWHQRHAFDDGH